MLLWLDSRAVGVPQTDRFTIKLDPPLIASRLSRFTVLELNVKNIRGADNTYSIVYLCTDITEPTLLNSERLGVVACILRPVGTAWGHKFWSDLHKPVSVPVWPGQYHKFSLWLVNANGARLAFDHLAAVVRIEEE